MKKQIKNRLPGPLTIAFLILNILLLAILGSCQKEVGMQPRTSRTETDSTITVDTTGTGLPGAFQKTYGGPDNDYIGNVEQTSDSGYVIIGTTTSYGAGYGDVYVIKTNADGNIQWTKTYGKAADYPGTNFGEEEGYTIKQTSDGGYIMGGLGYVCDGYYENFVLIKTDAAGNAQWSKSYGYFGSGDNYDVLQTSDGGYILVGPASSSDGILCIRTDKNGVTVWCKQYSGAVDGAFIVKTDDGGYAITGTIPGILGNEDILLIKTDNVGNVLWSKTYGSLSPERSASLKQTTDGGFIIVASALVIKTDADGQLIWSKKYEEASSAWVSEIEPTTDGGYILSGKASLIKIDAAGDITWSKIYGGDKDEYGFSVHQVKDGGYIIGGSTSSFGAGNRDIYLIKTDSKGNCGCYETVLTPTATTAAIQVTSPSIFVTTGSFYCGCDFLVGTGGIETKICPK